MSSRRSQGPASPALRWVRNSFYLQEQPMSSVSPIDDQTRLQRVPGILAEPVKDQLLMMQVETESYFLLSPVTARIWSLLESPCTVAEVVQRLVAEYEVAPEVCRTEVIDVLRGLAEQHMVQVIS
jgi:hypothetical protein